MFQPKQVTPEVAEFLSDYADFVRVQKGKGGRPSVSESTLDKHTHRAREIVEGLGFEFSAERLKAFMVRKTIRRAAGTWNQWVDAVKMLDRYVRRREKVAQPCAIKAGFYDPDLIGRLAVPKRSRKVHDPFSRQELDAMIEAATKQGDEEFAMWLRVDWNLLGRAESEINQIKLGDFAFGTQQAREYDADAEVYLGENITEAKKTGSGLVGFIWWPGDAALIHDWFERAGFEANEYIFKGRPSTAPNLKQYHAGRMKYHTALNKVRKYAMAANLTKRHSTHNVRAGAAVWLDQHGIGRTVIMELGRWESLAALERYLRPYSALMKESLGRARAAALASGAPFLEIRATEPKTAGSNRASEIREFAALLNDGFITEKQYEVERDRILSRVG